MVTRIPRKNQTPHGGAGRLGALVRCDVTGVTDVITDVTSYEGGAGQLDGPAWSVA